MKRLALSSILALGLAFSLTACGGDSGGGGSSASGPVGTWSLDMEAFREAMQAGMQKEMEGKSDAEIAMMKGFIEPMIKAFETATMDVTVKADGSWQGESNFPDGPSGKLKAEVSSGSWTLDGSQITMDTLERGGKKVEPGTDTVTGTLDGDVIRVKTNKPKDPEMILRRK